jgi:hypothetical protein
MLKLPSIKDNIGSLRIVSQFNYVTNGNNLAYLNTPCMIETVGNFTKICSTDYIQLI